MTYTTWRFCYVNAKWALKRELKVCEIYWEKTNTVSAPFSGGHNFQTQILKRGDQTKTSAWGDLKSSFNTYLPYKTIINIRRVCRLFWNIIVKYVQHVGIILLSAWGGSAFLSFSLPGGDRKKMLGCGLLAEISTQSDTMPNVTILTSLKLQNFLYQPWLPTSILPPKKFLATPLELQALNWWFFGLIKINKNETNTCRYKSCWSDDLS